MTKDLTTLIERELLIEKHLNISFSGLYASIREDQIFVNGDLRALTGATIVNDMHIVANFYDSRGRVVDTVTGFLQSERFFGLESFSLVSELTDDQPDITRILIFAKKF